MFGGVNKEKYCEIRIRYPTIRVNLRCYYFGYKTVGGGCSEMNMPASFGGSSRVAES